MGTSWNLATFHDVERQRDESFLLLCSLHPSDDRKGQLLLLVQPLRIYTIYLNPKTFLFLAYLLRNWGRPLAHQPHDLGCQANLCRFPASEFVLIYMFAWWRNRTWCILSASRNYSLLWHFVVLGLSILTCDHNYFFL